jgi:hypothetical protein
MTTFPQGDCPTCRYHPIYTNTQPIGVLCVHPLGELYREEFDPLHLVSVCTGWIEKTS